MPGGLFYLVRHSLLLVGVIRLCEKFAGLCVMLTTKIQKSHLGINIGGGYRAFHRFLVQRTISGYIIIKCQLRLIYFCVGAGKEEVVVVNDVLAVALTRIDERFFGVSDCLFVFFGGEITVSRLIEKRCCNFLVAFFFCNIYDAIGS